MEALDDVVKAGYVRYLGISSCWAWQCTFFHSLNIGRWTSDNNILFAVHLMQSEFFSQFIPTIPTHIDTDYALANNLTPFISMQNHYSLLYREEEREMMPTLKVRCVSSAAMP